MTNKNGKFQSPSRPREKRSPVVRGLLIFFAVLFIVSAVGLTVCLTQMAKARSDFRRLSELVQQNTPVTTLPAETDTQDALAPEETRPPETEPAEPEMLAKYVPLYEQNPDLFGWLRIDGTVIDYPVMHTPADPEKYLHTNFAGEYNFAGIPFVDGACSPDSDNLLIYGHNMLDGSMFRSLMKYKDEAYWRSHPTIHFDTLYEEGEYEVLAAFYDRVYYSNETCFKFYQFIDAEDAADFDNAVANFRAKALYDTGVTAAYGDKLITLVTCAYHVEDGRFVVVARKK